MVREKKLTCLSGVRVFSDGPANGEHVFHRHGADDAGDLRLTLSAVPANKFGRDRGKEAAPLPARAAVGFGFLEGELSKKRDMGRRSTEGVPGSVCAYPLNPSIQRW